MKFPTIIFTYNTPSSSLFQTFLCVCQNSILNLSLNANFPLTFELYKSAFPNMGFSPS